jgi:Leucine-rich repeat (LRR) protein
MAGKAAADKERTISTGCSISEGKDGKTLVCKGVSFDVVLSKVEDLGNAIVVLKVWSCHPLVSVSLNELNFANNTNMRSLSISSCGIEYIAPYTFQNLVDLTELLLSDNDIIILMKGTFYGLENLLQLHLTLNSINYILEGTLSDLNNLETLSLAQNKAFRPSGHLLAGMIHLKHLDLSGVNIAGALDFNFGLQGPRKLVG